MTTIYLHIGMPKTGTTYIQKTLFHNREQLLKNGYLYPMSGMRHNAKEIVDRYCHNSLAHLLMDILEKDNLLAQVPGWEDLKKEIDSINPKNVIISAEAFTSFEVFYQPQTLTKIKEFLKEYEVKIVIYLRRQDEFLESAYCYMVKLGACTVGIQDLFNQYQYIFNYYQMLENWADIFGQENIIVRRFDKFNIKNNIFDDFLEIINQFYNKNDYKVDYAAKINASASGKMIKLFLLINNFNEKILANFLKLDDNYWSNYQSFLSFLSKNQTICKLVSNLPKFLIDDMLISPKERQDLMEGFKELNSRIANKYLGEKNGILFSDRY